MKSIFFGSFIFIILASALVAATPISNAGNALYLNGTNNASAADKPSLTLGANGRNFTIEAWIFIGSMDIEPPSAKAMSLIYKNSAYKLNFEFNDALNSTDNTYFSVYSGSSWYILEYNDAGWWEGWHHIAGVFDNTHNKLELYMDGMKAANMTFSLNSIDSVYNLTAGQQFKGMIDEMRFSNSTRYTEDYYEIPTEPFVPDQNTAALWHFDEPSNSTIFFDASTNKNNLTGKGGAHTISANIPPKIMHVSNKTAYEQAFINLTIAATDYEYDALNYSINDTRFTKASNNKFSWKTELGDAGTYFLNISVSDGQNLASIIATATVLKNITPQYQYTEGFSSIINAAYSGEQLSYNGNLSTSYWGYAWNDSNIIEWETAPVPLNYTSGKITFIWSGSNGPDRGKFDVYLNGTKVIQIDSGKSSDYSSSSKDFSIFFDYKNNNTWNSGVYYFTAPNYSITPGEKSRITLMPTGGRNQSNWLMVFNITGTADYELGLGALDYENIGKSADIVNPGNCSDSKKSWGESGVDCGGVCLLAAPEICNGIDDNKNCIIDDGADCTVNFSYGHYTAFVHKDFLNATQSYVAQVNDRAYPVMVDALGFNPAVSNYLANFTPNVFEGFYYGVINISINASNFTLGHIVLNDDPVRNPLPYPQNMCHALVGETIHGFTDSLKRNITTGESRHSMISMGNNFDLIFEVEVQKRLNSTECINDTLIRYYEDLSFPNFRVYWSIRSNYTWVPLKKYILLLENMSSAVHVDTDDDECYYLSMIIGEDISYIYESHNIFISEEAKQRILEELLVRNANIKLIKGWNLISFPIELNNYSIKSIFNKTKFKSVFAYNSSWLYYFNESRNNFREISPLQGIWINSLLNQTVNLSGKKFEYPLAFNLNKGYNLIGYPSVIGNPVESQLEYVEVKEILNYRNKSWEAYYPARAYTSNFVSNLTPGRGYWAILDEDAAWMFDGKIFTY